MSATNIRKLVKEYLNRLDSINLPDDCYNFRNVRLAVKQGSVQLFGVLDEDVGDIKTKVTFQKFNGSERPEALAIIRASVEHSFKDRTIIERGVIKGLEHSKINIPLDSERLEDISTDITIDISKKVQETKLQQQESYITERNIGRGTAAANVFTRGKKHIVQFECVLIMTGLVTYKSGRSEGKTDIAEAVRGLQSTNRDSVIGLSPIYKNVEFMVKGEMEFRRPDQPIIKWL